MEGYSVPTEELFDGLFSGYSVQILCIRINILTNAGFSTGIIPVFLYLPTFLCDVYQQEINFVFSLLIIDKYNYISIYIVIKVVSETKVSHIFNNEFMVHK